MTIEKNTKPIPIIDLFAGPGGLGEGFSQFVYSGINSFKISLSIEKDKNAHQTLLLRSFFRQFESDKVPEEYYSFIRGDISQKELYDKYSFEYEKALNETWNAKLGEINEIELDKRIANAIRSHENWVLIGGPPCQAYSIAGRARNKAKKGYVAEEDSRHFLYKQYLRIIANHWPSVFIMENVRGILSSKINGNLIFPKILQDLKDPGSVFKGVGKKKKYRIFSMVKPPDAFSIAGDPIYKNPSDFIIECEKYGIPQARHRVILMGIREDFCSTDYPVLEKKSSIQVKEVLSGLPRLRSGFSKGEDNKKRWMDCLDGIIDTKWYDSLLHDSTFIDVVEQIFNENFHLKKPQKDRGGEFIPFKAKTEYLENWYLDDRIGGVCNSTTRAHLESDLHRYFFASCFAKTRHRSPILDEFPEKLLPNHKNVKTATRARGNFADRFRVQVGIKPATTIMSHISKDGHYYIHYDPTQCRSLTVREAARLQTFPDNYFFCGSRTQQYIQVGNAVPPYLALQISNIVHKIIFRNRLGSLNGHTDKSETKLEHVPN